jgi:hypothetical protein
MQRHCLSHPVAEAMSQIVGRQVGYTCVLGVFADDPLQLVGAAALLRFWTRAITLDLQ